jgi:hypothetical protein
MSEMVTIKCKLCPWKITFSPDNRSRSTYKPQGDRTDITFARQVRHLHDVHPRLIQYLPKDCWGLVNLAWIHPEEKVELGSRWFTVTSIEEVEHLCPSL